jgi:hypothetical protein
MTYKMTDRFFSHKWRRNKKYSEHELRWLSKRYDLNLDKRGTLITITGPREIVHFKALPDESGEPSASLAPR